MWVVANKTKLEYIILPKTISTREEAWQYFLSLTTSRDWVIDSLYAKLNNIDEDKLLVKEVEDEKDLKEKKYKNVTKYFQKSDVIDLEEGKFTSDKHKKKDLENFSRKELLVILKEVKIECLNSMCVRDSTNISKLKKVDLLNGIGICKGKKTEEEFSLFISKNKHKTRPQLYKELMEMKRKQHKKHLCPSEPISTMTKDVIIKNILKCQKKT